MKEFEQLSATLRQYQSQFLVFQNAQQFLKDLEDIISSHSSVVSEVNVAKKELEEIEQTLKARKEERISLEKEIQSKRNEAEAQVEELYNNKLKSASEKAAEMLKEARDSFHESTYHVRILQEDAKAYEEKIEKARAEYEELETKLARVKRDLQSIINA